MSRFPGLKTANPKATVMSGYRDRPPMSGNRQMHREEVGAVKPYRPMSVPGSGGPAARRRLEQSPVTAFLRDINMPQYAAIMRDHGFFGGESVDL